MYLILYGNYHLRNQYRIDAGRLNSLLLVAFAEYETVLVWNLTTCVCFFGIAQKSDDRHLWLVASSRGTGKSYGRLMTKRRE